MSYSKDREWFVAKMSRECPMVPLETWRTALRCAGILQRAAEVDCSVSNDAIRADSERRAKAAARVLADIFPRQVSPRFVVTVDGDPRGYVCALYREGQNTDTDEPFARIPANGYSASQMDRMTR